MNKKKTVEVKDNTEFTSLEEMVEDMRKKNVGVM
jgi:hypothetical protein